MSEEEIISKLIDTIDSAVNDINTAIPGIQQDIANDLDQLLRSLDLKGDTIQANVANLKKIAAFKDRILAIIKRSDYPDKVSEFLKSFDEVAKLNNQYFSQIASDFKPTALLAEIQNQSIDSTLESLTEAGINANVIQPLYDVLLKNITTGGSWSQLSGQVRDIILSNENGLGALERYTKQITTDSLNQYSAQYMNAVTNDLGLEWYMYVGAVIRTSRPFCEACVKKKYIHQSEIPQLLAGDFPEFDEYDGKLGKNGLPAGMVDGTNPENFHIYRGGYNCGHQLVPVDSLAVPELIRKQFED